MMHRWKYLTNSKPHAQIPVRTPVSPLKPTIQSRQVSVTGGQRKSIVIVDDEEILRDLISNELKSRGYECVALASKREAYAWCLKHRPDLVITDIRSPDMDGFQLLRLLKANAGTRKVPIVFLTGYADEKNAALARQLGAAEFLSKPCKINEFESVIERLIGTAGV
jgi:two-component system cell cycle response regulator DivK